MISGEVVQKAWKRYVEGDKEAFGDVYDHYHRVLTLYCLGKLKDLEQAENAASDCMVKLLQQRRPEQIEHLDHWIFTVAKNLCNTHWSKSNRRGVILQHVGALQKTHHQSEATNRLNAEDLERLLISILDEDKYSIWKLHEEGYDNEEIANKLGIKPKTVANKKSEARKAIRAAIKKSNGEKEE